MHARVGVGLVCAVGIVPSGATSGEQLGVDPAAAARIRQQFMQRFPAVGRFMEAVKRFAASHGFVLTMAVRGARSEQWSSVALAFA
jgi:DNA polymerase I-like protein with 3'-5' exonuclease and polymerase domains